MVGDLQGYHSLANQCTVSVLSLFLVHWVYAEVETLC